MNRATLLFAALLIYGCVQGATSPPGLKKDEPWTLERAKTASGESRNSRPFSGAFYDWWRPDIKALMFYEDGKLNGPVIAWYEKGAKMFEGQMKDDLKVGIWRHWAIDGKLLAEGEYKAGKPWNGLFVEGYAPPLEYVNGVARYPGQK